MKLVRTTILSGIITIVRIASGFVASKVVAMFTGPSGVALIGAFTNFITIALTFANGAINTGVVKYTAEYEFQEYKLKKLISTSLKISVYSSALIGLILFFFASTWSELIFTTKHYTMPIRVFGVTIILYSLNSLIISILNGMGKIKVYTIVNSLGSFIGLIFTVALVYFFQLNGAMYALVLSQSIIFFATLILVIKNRWFNWEYFSQPFDKKIAGNLGHFTIMAIISAITLPFSQIIIRNMITHKLGIEVAGYWQGMLRISDGYLMIVTTSLSTYYLPRISSLNTDKEIRAEILHVLRIILPAVFFGCAAIYVLRFFIIKTLYTVEFLQMESLFFWQLVGDFFKIFAWVFGYLMIAKVMTRLYVSTDILFNVIYVVLGYLLVYYIGIQGITIAFAIAYLVYFLAMLVIFRKLLFLKPNSITKNI